MNGKTGESEVPPTVFVSGMGSAPPRRPASAARHGVCPRPMMGSLLPGAATSPAPAARHGVCPRPMMGSLLPDVATTTSGTGSQARRLPTTA